MKIKLSRNKRYIIVSPRPKRLWRNALKAFYTIDGTVNLMTTDLYRGKRKYELPENAIGNVIEYRITL